MLEDEVEAQIAYFYGCTTQIISPCLLLWIESSRLVQFGPKPFAPPRGRLRIAVEVVSDTIQSTALASSFSPSLTVSHLLDRPVPWMPAVWPGMDAPIRGFQTMVRT